MKDFPKRIKSTLAFLLEDSQVITGKNLIKRNQEAEKEVAKQRAILQEAIE